MYAFEVFLDFIGDSYDETLRTITELALCGHLRSVATTAQLSTKRPLACKGIKTPRDVGRLGVRPANPFVLPLLLPVEWAKVAHNFSPIRTSTTPDFGKCERCMERLWRWVRWLHVDLTRD